MTETLDWNGAAARGWVDAQPLLDQIFRPIEELIVEAVTAAAASSVLDVGCGTGATTLAIAQVLGSSGRCSGVDVAEPMIATARDRAERESSSARFVVADAQRHAFEPASYDMIVSRFGVMFFDDPIAAFKNLRRAATSRAELLCIPWRSAEENAFMTTAERYAAPLLPNIPVRKPGAPGQFALADEHVIRRTLAASGWTDVDVAPIDVGCAFPEAELLKYITRLGPVGRMLHDMDEETRTHVTEVVRAAFEPFVHGVEVRFTAACWIARARALL